MRRPDPLPQRPHRGADDSSTPRDDAGPVDADTGVDADSVQAAPDSEGCDADATDDDDLDAALDRMLAGEEVSDPPVVQSTTAIITPLWPREAREGVARGGEADQPRTPEVAGAPDDRDAIDTVEPADDLAHELAGPSRVDDDSDDAATAGTGTSRGVGWRDVWRATRAKRKALRSEVRRFTVRARRRRLVWLTSLGALALLIVGSIAVVYSPLFAVRTITITGAHTIDAAALEQSLSSQIGTPLALVDDSKIKAALVTYPFVETYTVQARPPHELVVSIVERTPIGVVQSDAGYSLVDAAGVVLATTPEAPAGYPVVDVPGRLSDATFRSAGMVMLSIPADLRAQVSHVTATSPSDVTLTLAPSGAQVIWGNADDSQIKAITLEKALVANPLGTVSVYDISSPSAIVMR